MSRAQVSDACWQLLQELEQFVMVPQDKVRFGLCSDCVPGFRTLLVYGLCAALPYLHVPILTGCGGAGMPVP